MGANDLAILDALAAAFAEDEAVALVTVIGSNDRGQIGAKAVVWLDRPPLGALGLGDIESRALDDARVALASGRHRTLRYPDAGLELFVEVQRRPPQLLIVGAGHIAAPLCELAALCDFAVTVIDDRPSLATPERFPKARSVIAADIRQTVSELAKGRDMYVVLVTRGHNLDVECLIEIIDRPLAYIGMIGSQRRVRAVFELLEKETGIARSKLERVHAPIGLPIGAETPAEIAVCIMAEIINVMRGGSAISLSESRRRK